jgi:hypothetical protein
MDHEERDKDTKNEVTVQKNQRRVETSLPPWVFRHKDLIRAITSADCIKKNKMINILNYLHFKGDPLYVLLMHPQYNEEILVKVWHEPCFIGELICHWDQIHLDYKLEKYRFQYLIISYDQSIILVSPQLFLTDSDKVTLQLPETGMVISERQDPRFRCRDVKVELWQNGFQAAGELVDFSPRAFRIQVTSIPDSSFAWFNVDAQVTLRLYDQANIFFAGECNCMYQRQNGQGREIVAAPVHDRIQRFKTKAMRNPRKQSLPILYAIFEHPLTKRLVQREIFDISTSGFSICDKTGESVLIPGLIIPEVTIAYAGLLKIHCKVQVVYRKEEEHQVRFGLVMLDIDLTNYRKLNQILNNINGEKTSTSNEVDLDALWEFFFDTDFIYPQKYKFLHTVKDDFQAVYRKLYEDAPELASHFTYQKNGRIYGHISMLRVYDRTWMIHHHAGRPLEGRSAGLLVLKQLLVYLNDLHRLPSANMDYAIAYFRPENEFPERMFGEFAMELDNPQLCSLDLFTYINYQPERATGSLSADWSLRDCSIPDFWNFQRFYQNRSGGLFASTLKREDRQNSLSLEEIYVSYGLIRRWKTYALTYRDTMKAFIVAEESDTRINLSNLLNGFKFFVMDPYLPPDIIFKAISELSMTTSPASLSVLCYPDDYAKRAFIGYETKRYHLWIANMEIGNKFLEYLERKFRIKLR